MGWISAVFAHKVLRSAEVDAGLRAQLSRSVGVDADGDADPAQMLEDSAFFGLLERLVGQEPSQRTIGVEVGASMRCDDYGSFGLAFKSAVDLMGSYQRVERFGRVVTSIANFRVVKGEPESRMEVIREGAERLGMQMTRELAVSAAVSLSREVSQRDFEARRVCFVHAAPDERSAFEAYFRCPVEFGAAYDALEVSNEVLRGPNRLGDASISRFFDGHLDEALTELPQGSALERRVRVELAQALSEGVPTLAQMARRLKMSGRTLQRRLAEDGLAYKALLEGERRELAGRLLRGSDYSLAEVAFLTGFSDQSTFSRAFKRWTGQTPRSYRRSQA